MVRDKIENQYCTSTSLYDLVEESVKRGKCEEKVTHVAILWKVESVENLLPSRRLLLHLKNRKFNL